MVGYGTWEFPESSDSLKKTTANQPYVGKKQPRTEIQKNIYAYIPESVRAHAFVWTVRVPLDMDNWSNKKRGQYLDRHNIEYKSLGIFGGGQSLVVKGHRVWLTNKSLVIYDTDSYFAETAIAAKSTAVHSLISIIRSIERLLHADFTIQGDWAFQPSRHHYAIIKNSLARQYDEEGKKLEVRDPEDNSLWLWIDNSYGMHETETGHKDTADDDSRKIQNHLNSVRDTGETMYTVRELKESQEFVMSAMVGIQGNQQSITGNQITMAENTESHIAAIQDLGAGVKTFNTLLEKLFRKLEGDDQP